MKKALCVVLVFIIFILTVCVAGAQANGEIKYQSYKEIPGVTQDDIAAVDDLLAKKPRLVYGLIVTSEAFIREDGSVGGFASLLCKRMTELFGFDFDIQPYTWEELVEKALSKEIDFVGDLTATPERLQKYIMTDAIAQRTFKVFTNRNAANLEVTAEYRPIVCAFLNGGATYQRVADSWELPFEPVFIDDESKVPELLLNREIDAFVEEGVLEAVYEVHEFIEAEEYYPITYSTVSLATGNPELAPIINIMQKYLKNGGSYELADLYTQGHNEYLENKLSTILTDEEKEYILRHNTDETAVLAAYETYNYPVSFYNQNEKEFQGVAIDVLKQISSLTGLKFKAGNNSQASWSELMHGLESGQYSVVTELLQTPQRKELFFWAAEPYYSDNYAMLSKSDYPDVSINQILFSKIGLLEDTASAEVFLEWFPDYTDAKKYINTDDAIAALEKGEIDLLMISRNMLLQLINYLEKPDFKTNIVFNYSTHSYFGFNKNEEILCSIINKTQRFIDTEEITEAWKRKTFDYSSKIINDMMPYIIAFVILLIAALFVVLFLFLKNKQMNKNLEKLVAERTSELSLQTYTLTTIFESIPDIIFCKDLDLRFTRCNKSFERHFACAEKDIIGKNDVEGLGIPPELAEGFNKADMQIIRERKMVLVEELIPSANGDAPLFETVKIPLMQDGEVVGIMGISRDITQRKEAEETLKITLDNLDTCIYISDIETGEILFINEKMIEEFGGGEFYGKICWEVLQDGFTERCEFCPIYKLQESGDEYYVWEEHNTVTGKHYKNTDSLIKWHNGKLVHMQHSVDITAEVKLQHDLEQASRAKSDFLSRMSHEIRTPLNAIIGMIGIAMASGDTSRIKHCLDRAENASKHLLSLINDILDMSKIEADKFELSVSEFDFEKMLMNITNVTHFRAEEKHQNFIVNLENDVPLYINGDELRLSQVITNLLTNAVKFTPENGTVKLNIMKTKEMGSEIELKIEVEDNGIGITEEQQKRLFTSFEQADGGIARKFGGTGLGLAISKRIVELMGGKIWIESEPDKGSKFIFTIKVQNGKIKAKAKLSEKISRESLRILAVDDSDDIREYFTHVFSSLKLPCDVASGGQEALDMLKNSGDKPYNIFFVDWRMPEMDGIELTKKIKQITEDNSVVFMISASEWVNIEADALAAGVKDFVPKPLFPSTLVNVINDCLEPETRKVLSSAPASKTQARQKFDNHTILIAEDIEINREIMSALLEDSGISIDYAENGKIAVSMFESQPDKYSLIFMDIHMPEMDGYEATRNIRALEIPRAKSIPIIAMTANVFKEDIDNCLAVGMNDHTGKPISLDDLYMKLDKYLS